ncbi:MAG: LysM peptidoglycan-binding domain-containing protein [Verrucomicrobia bacterium]|nr:LysM peptidoglycan-binding domain-containing protein [Verrucomicrobiota bacterium]MBV9657808.1 LysM peptidoglycan-binding domain-containing protein [Verrucomicrobiota bacterium]
MRIFKALVILFLLAGLAAFGLGSWYFLVYKPQQDDARAVATAGARSQATPDPSSPDFEKARALRREHKLPEARAALMALLDKFPDSSHRDEVEAMIGGINVESALNGLPGPDKLEYTVRSGDTLDKVARRLKSSAELIFRANGLTTSRLRIGQKLVVPQLDVALEIHLDDHKVLLRNRGAFFKSYRIKTLRVQVKKTFPEIKTKVFEKLAFKNGLRVIFGSPGFAESIRAISVVGQPGYTIFGEPDDPAGEKPPAGGIGLEAGDVEEIHALVNVGTPVTITKE